MQHLPAKGLQSFHCARYANSVIQCLNRIPELVSRFRQRRHGTLDYTKLRGITDAALLELQSNTRAGFQYYVDPLCMSYLPPGEVL